MQLSKRINEFVYIELSGKDWGIIQNYNKIILNPFHDLTQI